MHNNNKQQQRSLALKSYKSVKHREIFNLFVSIVTPEAVWTIRVWSPMNHCLIKTVDTVKRKKKRNRERKKKKEKKWH